MFIREIKKRNKAYEKEFICHRLVESYRTEKGPRQRVILDLGCLTIPKDQWKALADAIEAKVSGQKILFAIAAEIDTLATHYAQQIIQQHLQQQPLPEPEEPPEKEFETIDVGSLQNSRCRTIGGEYVGLEACQRLGLESFFEKLGFTHKQIQLALLSIVGRLVHPGSELKTANWARHLSGISELLGVDFSHLSHNALYRISDLLLEHKDEIESYLAETERNLFSLPEKIILYDLTNTYFEGGAQGNVKARRGRSKENRTDCPLLTLALVIDEQGFVKTSRILPGNISEPGTLEETLNALQSTRYNPTPKAKQPGNGITVVMDAGIATKDNLHLLIKQGYDYIVVSRQKVTRPKEKLLEPLVTVKEDPRNKVETKLYIEGDEAILFCKSKMKAAKEQSMRKLFEERLEQDLKEAAAALHTKGGVKTFDKVMERVNRLIEKHKSISQYYRIEVQQQERRATSITWEKINQERAEERFSGTYYLRTSRIDLNEQEIWSLYTMLTNLEDAFRSLKSELNLRPIFHRKESRSDAHIFIAVLAYRLLNVIQTELTKNNIHIQWWRIRELLSSHVRITTAFTTQDRRRVYVRKTSQAETFHRMIYDVLHLSHRPVKTKRYVT
jgi:transposase